MKKKTVKLVSAVVALGVVSGAYVGVNSYVSSQEKKESEAEDTSVELTSLDTDNITSVAFTAGQDKVEFDKKDDTWSEKGDADFFFIMPFSFSAILQSQLPGMQVGSVP